MKLIQDKAGNGSTFEQIRQLIGHPGELKYVNVEDTHFECLDGRNQKGILATPGGDAGEFILALHIYDDLLGGNRKLTQEAVDTYLKRYLEWMRQDIFYMCTDENALHHLEKEVGVEGVNIINPRPQLRDELLKVIAKPDNVGCLHTRMLLKYKDLYQSKAELVQMTIKAFYKILWDVQNPLSKRLKLGILMGEHNETAFMEVRLNDACKNEKVAPLLQPYNRKTMVFLNHVDPVSIRRAQLANFFVNEINRHQQPIDPVILWLLCMISHRRSSIID
jgi:hypothetical protein